jgi:hypothetical protein
LKIKKSLSIEENVFEDAKIKAKEIGFNFSAYITYLINKDLRDVSEPIKTPTIKNSKLNDAIDDILG